MDLFVIIVISLSIPVSVVLLILFIVKYVLKKDEYSNTINYQTKEPLGLQPDENGIYKHYCPNCTVETLSFSKRSIFIKCFNCNYTFSYSELVGRINCIYELEQQREINKAIIEREKNKELELLNEEGRKEKEDKVRRIEEVLKSNNFERIKPNYYKFSKNNLNEELYTKRKKDFYESKCVHLGKGIDSFGDIINIDITFGFKKIFLNKWDNKGKDFYEIELDVYPRKYDNLDRKIKALYYDNSNNKLLVIGNDNYFIICNIDEPSDIEHFEYMLTLRQYTFEKNLADKKIISAFNIKELNVIKMLYEKMDTIKLELIENEYIFFEKKICDNIKEIDPSFYNTFNSIDVIDNEIDSNNILSNEYVYYLLDIYNLNYSNTVEFDKQKFLDLVNDALLKVYDNDKAILERGVNERTIMVCFAKYLSEELDKTNLKWFDLDCEFNKDVDNDNGLKTRKDNKHIVPDIILHQRGNNNNNACVIEIKKMNSNINGCEEDRIKLKQLTGHDLHYNFKLGLHLFITKEIENCHFDLYENGEKITSLKLISKNGTEKERRKMSLSLRYAVMKRDNFKCVLCGKSVDNGALLEVDHIVPISKGGLTKLDNLQTLCFECNRGKSNSL